MAIRDPEAEYTEYDRDEDDWRRYEFPRYVEAPDQGYDLADSANYAEWMQGRGVNGLPLPELPPTRPATPMQALMESAPGSAPIESTVELGNRLSAVRDVLESEVLSHEEQEVVSRLFFQGQSLRDAGDDMRIGKTTVASIRDRALARIAEELQDG